MNITFTAIESPLFRELLILLMTIIRDLLPKTGDTIWN